MILSDVGVASHGIAALSFAGLAAVALWRRLNAINLLLALAAVLAAAWALLFVAAGTVWPDALPWISRLQTLKVAALAGLLLYLLGGGWQDEARGRSAFAVGGTLGFVVALQLALDLAGVAADGLTARGTAMADLFLVMRIGVAVTGLVLTQNLFNASLLETRSGLRLLAIGIGWLFLYDLNFYTLSFLLPPPSVDLYNIRGAADALAVPLLIFATRESWTGGARVSRQLVFQTVAFSGVGFYLIAMSLLAYALKLVGGNWGVLLQVTFLSATILLGMVVAVSPRFRAWLRVQIAKNFFRYKYDYRKEWLRFIATVSASQQAGPLPVRVVQAICTVLDSPGGAILLPEDDRLVPLADWQMPGAANDPVLNAGPLLAWMQQDSRVIDLAALRLDEPEYDDLQCPPAWRANDQLWLVVPLFHQESLVGVVLVGRGLVDRALNWEDFDLLKTLGRQAGSYIAEATSQQALEQAQRFEDFNRRFAFILHDIKNLVSQLSLVARNAERHADNPEFRADMVATLQSSVGKMNTLLAWLGQRGPGKGEGRDDLVPLGRMLQLLVRDRHGRWPGLHLALPAGDDTLPVRGDGSRLEQMFAHLIENAMDASAPGSPINIDCRVQDGAALVSIADHGHGMSAAFIRGDLFQPFRSTKAGGFGIGAYEAREIARAHGGALDVASREGEGTTFTVTLPLASSSVAGIAAQ
jgi:putative PEP-CTERM system histidine kinase